MVAVNITSLPVFCLLTAESPDIRQAQLEQRREGYLQHREVNQDVPLFEQASVHTKMINFHSKLASLEFHTCTSCLAHLHSIALFHNSCMAQASYTGMHATTPSSSLRLAPQFLHSPSNIECEGVHKITENLNWIWYCSTNSPKELLQVFLWFLSIGLIPIYLLGANNVTYLVPGNWTVSHTNYPFLHPPPPLNCSHTHRCPQYVLASSALRTDTCMNCLFPQ